MALLREPAKNARSMERVAASKLANEGALALDLLIRYVAEADGASLILEFVQFCIVVVNLLHRKIVFVESLDFVAVLIVIDWLELAIIVAHDHVQGLQVLDERLRLLLKPVDLVQHDVKACHVLPQFAEIRQIALDLVLTIGSSMAVEARVRLHPAQVLEFAVVIHHCTLPPAHIAITTV